MLKFYDNTMANIYKISDLSLLWKLWKTLMLMLFALVNRINH